MLFKNCFLLVFYNCFSTNIFYNLIVPCLTAIYQGLVLALYCELLTSLLLISFYPLAPSIHRDLLVLVDICSQCGETPPARAARPHQKCVAPLSAQHSCYPHYVLCRIRKQYQLHLGSGRGVIFFQVELKQKHATFSRPTCSIVLIDLGVEYELNALGGGV